MKSQNAKKAGSKLLALRQNKKKLTMAQEEQDRSTQTTFLHKGSRISSDPNKNENEEERDKKATILEYKSMRVNAIVKTQG